MRLIDADALKKEFEAWKTMDDYYHDTDCDDIPLSEAFDLIDNAPTVELTEEYDLPNTHIDVYSYRCGWNEALNRAGIALKSGIRPIIKGEKKRNEY